MEFEYLKPLWLEIEYLKPLRLEVEYLKPLRLEFEYLKPLRAGISVSQATGLELEYLNQGISSYADGISSYDARTWSISRYLKL